MRYYRNYGAKNINLAPIDDLVKVLPTHEQTGKIVTFDSPFTGLPLKSCKVAIPVTQEGTGDPSPENVRNFVGISAINISHSNRNLLPYTFEDIISANGGQSTWTDKQKTINGLTFTLNTDSNGKLTSITINGTATYNTAFYLNSRFTSIYFPASTLYSGVSSNVAGYSARISHSGGQIISSTSVAVPKKNYSNCDIILFFNSGNTFDLTVSPRLILSVESDNSYVPHMGTYKYIDFGQTIYAGELDVLRGIITVTHKMVDLGSLTWNRYTNAKKTYFRTASEIADCVKSTSVNTTFGLYCSSYIEGAWTKTIDSNGYENQFTLGWANHSYIGIYDPNKTEMTVEDFKQAMTGIYILYPLAEPEVINLGGMDISTLQGENNLFSSVGDTTAEYYTL